jgi:hypothetical protein
MHRAGCQASPGPTPSHPIPPMKEPPEGEKQDEPGDEPLEKGPPAREPPDSRNPKRMLF